MADNAQKYGFRWVRSASGAPQPKPQRVRLASGLQATAGGTNVDIHAGDPIQILSTGVATLAVGSEGTQTIVYGIACGFGYQYDGTVMQPKNKYSSSTYGSLLERQTYIYVIPVVGQIWEVDCDDASTATTEAAYYALIGENADFALSADTTNAADPKATPRLDISTHNTTNTLQCRIEDIAPTPSNQDFSGNYVKLLVSFNKVQQAPYNTTGV